MKRVLITGANSYIGTSFEEYVKNKDSNFEIDTLDLLDPNWEEFDFSGYDSIFHVAAIVHKREKKISYEEYKKVNTDLPVLIAKKAKKAGVSQFIFLSTMSVYGLNTGKIASSTLAIPTTKYGQSKYQAEEELLKLRDCQFKLVIVRPPIVYGKGSKGNYSILSKLTQLTPIFPKILNSRSMLHIDNLCEFIRKVIELELRGLFCPQNSEYVNTSELVKVIAEVHRKKIYFTKIFNPVIKLLFHFDTVKKVFGNLVYEKEMSRYDFEYQVINFEESIKNTEL
ncbi:NAD-dependent epimerase/dehydratase family protein [Streptococcus suis]|uniref:NAD-dependent epimerase/dehydratase family protein n=2 Tax=Streptococcus suis TaxID=1307 RepID=M1VDB3_STRSU|nr:NAD-dependent epimerase/dehydratase family protein [Streptococcus suis]MCK3959168.1 NAD-dependent epimerase/dehydratase family protein [Streptococcus suis]MDD7564962.1 NAD-dependent epimerase/dehydratase family protein [Streptococcus suis]TQE89397.1 NAD-dependent epimerase/dehydratase family protein [Streptococcus suis]BAM94605.1 NAD dependent epimerase/dehydratase family protein [Streptococcus suis]HEL2221503.1 NAD-dependent epimerase/dehydratase family protein [Streptococcus suis]